MSGGTKRTNAARGSEPDPSAIAPRTAALVLVVAAVVVGAVGYVVLSAVASESTITTSSCAPAAGPQCTGHAHPSESPTSVAGTGRGGTN
jgi:hypothetical protein